MWGRRFDDEKDHQPQKILVMVKEEEEEAKAKFQVK